MNLKALIRELQKAPRCLTPEEIAYAVAHATQHELIDLYMVARLTPESERALMDRARKFQPVRCLP